MRYFGASHDFITVARDLKAIQRRGRWLSWRSLRRYEKGPRVSLGMRQLAEAMLEPTTACGREIFQIEAGQRSALKGPS